VQELTGGLRVFCRIRAPLADEADGDTHSVTALDDTTVLLAPYPTPTHSLLPLPHPCP